jgi:hypothetical protein
MTQHEPTDDARPRTDRTRRTVLGSAAIAALGLGGISTAAAQQRGNSGNNGNGGRVTGMYKATYAYDENGDHYWYNRSNRGLEQGTVDSIDELDQETLTTCEYKVQYQGSFGDDPYLDMGWIRNNIVCTGENPDNQNVLYVSEEDHRYTGEGKPIWGTWEYFVDAQRGEGNVLVTDHVRPAQSD